MEKAYIFGRGNYLKLKYSAIRQKYDVIGFLDNAVKTEVFDEELGMYVYNPEKIRDLERTKIICVSVHFIEMWEQLIKLNINPEDIYFGCCIYPLYNGIEYTAFHHNEKLFAKKDCLIYKLENGCEYSFRTMEEFKSIIRHLVREQCVGVQAIAGISSSPVSRVFGSERGRAVDRYYIENFLQKYSDDIFGSVMEVGTNKYMKMFGKEHVTEEIIVHVNGWGKNAIKGNFETGEGLTENMVDCLICTQTLQYIYDLHSAMRNIYKILKPGGVALITVPGIKPLCSYDNDNWGEQWSFTPKSVTHLCEEVSGAEHFCVESFGNVKIAMAYLYGLCCEDMSEADFAYNDAQYPFLITMRIKKEA